MKALFRHKESGDLFAIEVDETGEVTALIIVYCRFVRWTVFDKAYSALALGLEERIAYWVMRIA